MKKRIICSLLLIPAFALAAMAQFPPPPPPTSQLPAPPQKLPVEKLSDTQFRIGKIHIDTAKREATVPGKVNPTSALEFVASARNGVKNYETALELDTDPINFNLAMILLGLDKAKGVPSKAQFDSTAPQGDPVELWVEWTGAGGKKKMKAEELLWNAERKATFAGTGWVYTGSMFMDGRFLAEVDGVLIGFVHTPSSIIERVDFERAPYGAVQLNPNLNLEPGTTVTLTVKAIKPNPKGRK
jgi:hypothetical protein